MYCQQVLAILGCNSYCKSCTLYTLSTMCILRWSLQYRLYFKYWQFCPTPQPAIIILYPWLHCKVPYTTQFPLLYNSLYFKLHCTIIIKKNRLCPLAIWPGTDRTTQHWAIPWACSSRPLTRQDIFKSEPARFWEKKGLAQTLAIWWVKAAYLVSKIASVSISLSGHGIDSGRDQRYFF